MVNRQTRILIVLATVLVAGLGTPLVAQIIHLGRSRTEVVGISKEIVGDYSLVADRHAACPDGQRTRAASFNIIEAPVVSGPCDEACSVTDLNGTFSARLTLVRRNNPEALLAGRGVLTGRWEIRNAGRVTARGTLSASVTADADGTDPENCSPEDYFEGVLEGRATGGACKGPFLVSISGSGLDPTLVDRDQRGRFTIRAEGSGTFPCPHD